MIKVPLKIDSVVSNKKIFFNDDGEKVEKKPEENQPLFGNNPKPKKNKSKFNQNRNGDDLETKWYQVFKEHNSDEYTEIKDSEFKTFQVFCKQCFDEEVQKLSKNNPNDAKWLETALHKGTSRDRANAGALLVQSNPLPNLSALDSLITLTKFSNKNSVDLLETVTELFRSLLPPHRKLIPLDLRGNDWKLLKSNKSLETAQRSQVYAYWQYEHELKGYYNAYLQNLQAALQNGKEINKIKVIISASNLLRNCPEREAFLLTILVNKFGDPDKKIASKATYHLRQILLTHPNMAHVMIIETEKLIFRNNINELAQHYGIGFLSLVAPIANAASSQKLIDICFCFFKIKIEKGDINSKTMQSILNCLRIAIQNINDFNEEKKAIDVTTPEVVNTIYRLIYLSNISIAFQALSLLLQLVIVQNEKHDRFYNALYRKMLDPDIINANVKITSLYFHIIHRAVHIDSNIARAKAFIKRLLQMALLFSPSKACGALIVISKILKTKSELKCFHFQDIKMKKSSLYETKNKLGLKPENDDDDDEEERYLDVTIDDNEKEVAIEKEQLSNGTSSWVHVQNSEKKKDEDLNNIKSQTIYDPFKRSAAYCGAEFSLTYELVLMSRYFHPTVQVFVQNILKSQAIKYYGDPLMDFSTSHFLERFSFKNPKKLDSNDEKSSFRRSYQAKGSRGKSVHSLTDQACTEDERFIFDFLQRKREIRETKTESKNEEKEEDDDELESIGDDEFDKYLDTLGAKNDFDKSEKEFDYLSELQNGKTIDRDRNKTIKQSKKIESDEESIDNWDDDEDDDGSSIEMNDNDDDNESCTDQSIGSDEDEINDDSDAQSENNEGTEMKSMKNKRMKEAKSNGKDINNIFVAVDDFSELIEKNSSNHKHGTLGEIFNKDKSSQKQLNWEEKRHNSFAGYKRKKQFSKKPFNAKKNKI